MNILKEQDESKTLFLEFKTKLNINDSIDIWTFHISTYRHDYCSLAKTKAIEELKSKNLHNDELEINFLTRKKIESGSHPIFNWKLERNAVDYKDDKSVFVRMDKDFITEDDINNFLTLFVQNKYKAFSDKEKIQTSLLVDELNVSFDKFNNYQLN